MSPFRPFEIEALHQLVSPVLGAETTDNVARNAEYVKYEYSGCGYFLTVKHESLPAKRIVCSEPLVVARSGQIEGGYIAFIENGQLMLECYTAGAIDIPEGFRDHHVEIVQSNELLDRTREK